jgi:hypothetical protein
MKIDVQLPNVSHAGVSDRLNDDLLDLERWENDGGTSR